MRMQTFVPIAAIVATVLVPRTAQAHFIWATIQDGKVRFALLENPSEKPSAAFGKYVEGLKTTLPLDAVTEGARSCTLPTDKRIVFADSVVGVKTREGVDYLLSYHAKAAVSLADAKTETKASAEVLAWKDGEILVVQVRQEGWPCPQSEVTIHWPGGGDQNTATTDLKGEVRIAWPKAGKPGILGVRAKVVEEKSGETEGKKYTQHHHWATLTFPVTASSGAASEPFSRTLRAAFGVNHDIVGKAAFNETLFRGTLTRQQLEVHLQQRALVHSEVDRILSAASPELNVPYASAQKNVLTLLRSDLNTLGLGWPIEAQARPLTVSFLQEIRESEKRGPYFALGVQHIYYGGITNGGRLIGQKISETLGVKLSYYYQSDGYQDYLQAVNRIVSPEAHAEMLRGGQAAYRYIIASSNEPLFKDTQVNLKGTQTNLR